MCSCTIQACIQYDVTSCSTIQVPGVLTSSILSGHKPNITTHNWKSETAVFAFKTDVVAMFDVIPDKGLSVNWRVLIRQQLLDRTKHPRRGRVEMGAEEAHDQDPCAVHHPTLHTSEPIMEIRLLV